MADRVLRVCALYPDLMNIYADRGNLLLLERRCAWRGIGFEVTRGRASATRSTRRARPVLHRRRPGPRPAAVRRRPRRDQARRAARRGRARAPSCSASAAATSCSGTTTSSATRRSPASGSSTCARCASDGPRLIGNVAIEVDLPRRGRAAGPGRLREPRRAHPPRRRRAAARARAARATATRARAASRACARGHRHRHLPARAAAAQERVVRRLADRHRARHRPRRAEPLDDALERRRARVGAPRGRCCSPSDRPAQAPTDPQVYRLVSSSCARTPPNRRGRRRCRSREAHGPPSSSCATSPSATPAPRRPRSRTCR